LVHMIDGKDMRDRFDRAYAARLAAGHTIPVGRGGWVPLYIEDSAEQASHVGGGAGLASPPIARIPLKAEDTDPTAVDESTEANHENEELFLTIPEAKRRLAITLGIDPSNIKITVEA